MTVQSLVIRRNTRRKYLSPNSLTRQSLFQLAIGSVSTGIGNGNTSSINASSEISSPFLKSPLSRSGEESYEAPLSFTPPPLLSLLVLHYQINKKWTDPVWFIHIFRIFSSKTSYVMFLSISTLLPRFLWRIDTIVCLFEKVVWSPISVN